jgi:Protein of unknown function (DUF3592)
LSQQVLDGIFVLLILLVVGLLLTIKRWPEWFRLARSARWPTVPGTVEGGEVSSRRGRSRGDQAIETATANLAYSYQLNGTYYSGYHIAVFDDEQEAWSYIDGLKGETVQVSYNRRRPDISVLRPQAVLGF